MRLRREFRQTCGVYIPAAWVEQEAGLTVLPALSKCAAHIVGEARKSSSENKAAMASQVDVLTGVRIILLSYA